MALTDFLTGAGIKQASADQIAAAQKGYADYTSAIDQARNAVTSYGGQAAAPWTALQPGSVNAFQHMLDLTGASGPEGAQRAQASFLTSPGYTFAVNQAIDAANRASVARGGAVGNNIADVTKLASGYAANEWQNYVDQAMKAASFAPQIAGGTSNVFTGLGTNIGNLYGQQGQAAMTTAQNIGNAQAQGDMADTVAGTNIANLGMNVAKMAMGMPPGTFGSPGGGAMPNNSMIGPTSASQPTGVYSLMSGFKNMFS